MTKLLLSLALAVWSATAWAQGGAPLGSPMAPAPVTSAPAAVPAPASPHVPQSYYQAPPPYPYPAAALPASPPAPPYAGPAYYYPPYSQPVYLPPPPPPPMPIVSLTFSPIHLLFPILEVTGELRLGQEAGVALIAGGGQVTDKASDGTKITFRVYEIGTQLRYYVTGNFRRGMEIGAEVLYVHVNGSLDNITGVASGLALGPFFGWKTTSYAGFTFEVQGGVEILTAGTKVTDSSGDSTSSTIDYVPLVNLNIGWSF